MSYSLDKERRILERRARTDPAAKERLQAHNRGTDYAHLPKLPFTAEALQASVCKDSFYEFVVHFWDTVIHEPPVWNWHMRVLCDTLQEAAERVIAKVPKAHDIVINIPPGTSKSTICSVMFPAWLWTRKASLRSICASYSFPLALDLSRKSRDVVQSDKWKKLFGSIELREDQNAKGYFLNEQGGSRYAVGTNGTVTGFHADVIIVDDPLDPNRAFSEADLKSANRWVTETLLTRKTDKAVTLTILIMQRLHENDPSAVMIKKSQVEHGTPVKHINLPAEITDDKRNRVRPRILRENYVDGLLDPIRLPRSVLQAMRVDLGEFAYSCQMLQHPVPLTGGMFKFERLLIDVPPQLKHFTELVRFWDKAGTAPPAKGSRRDRSAHTVGVLLGFHKPTSMYWVLDVVRGQWESAQREQIILQAAIADRNALGGKKTPAARRYIVGVEQEPGSGGKESAQNTVRSLRGFRVRAVRPMGDKALRADPFSVQVNGGNVRMVAATWNQVYLNEMQYFPNSTTKDQIDASSGAFTLISSPRVRVGAYDFSTTEED